MGVNKIDIINNGVTYTPIDLTQDTATEETVLEGYTFHKANGEIGTGTATSGSPNPYEDIIDNQVSSRKGNYLFSGCQDNDAQFAEHYTQAVADKIASITGLFTGCSNLTSIDLTKLPTFTANKTGSYMFQNCSSLTTLNGKVNFTDNRYISTTTNMFQGCSSLQTLDLSNWNFGTGSSRRDLMFSGCSNLTNLILPKDFGSADFTQTFVGTLNLTSLTFTNLNTRDCYSFKNMFGSSSSNASAIQTITFIVETSHPDPTLDTLVIRQEATIYRMFYYCTNLTTINYPFTKQDWKDNIAPYATLFDNNHITQTITVQCTDGQLVYTNVSGTFTYSITENSTTV